MTITLEDFSGGLNTRDSANEIAPNETPSALNWTNDTRGQTKLRNGCQTVCGLPGTSGKLAYIFYSEAIGGWLCVRENAGQMRLFTSGVALDGSPLGIWTNQGAVSLSLSTVVSFVDWPGTTPMVVISSGAIIGSGGPGAFTGGIYTWDGTTLTNRSVTIGGHAAALWQNRVWVAGYPSNDANGNLARLFACKDGDPTVWTAPDLTTQDIRDIDAHRLTALGVAGGALQVFKATSAYRITDSETGEYVTIDSAQGAAGPLAVVPQRGRLYTWGANGLCEWDGIGKGRNVGDKIRNFFGSSFDSAVCAGQLEDRVLFGLTTSLTFLVELDPQHGWVMEHLLSGLLPFISSFARKGAETYAACYIANAFVKVFSETPGADDGSLIGNHFRTKWIQPGNGSLSRIIRAQIEGLIATGGTTTLTMRVFKDWDTTTSDVYDLSADLRGGSANAQVERALVQALGHARSFAFEFAADTAAGAASINSLTLSPVAHEP